MPDKKSKYQKLKLIGYRPTWAEIDLGALEYNLKQVRNIIGSDVRILVTVKANAYGHGIIPIAKRLALCGIDYLGVASIDEGVILRDAGITMPILILGNILPLQVKPILDYHLTTTVSNKDVIISLNQEAQKRRCKVKIHIKVDTGMGRLGVDYTKAFGFIKETAKLSQISIEGLFTHFPCADTNRNLTCHQIKLMNQLIKKLEEVKINIPLKHAANSIATMKFKKSHFNLVRPGLMVYGLSPSDDINVKLKPVMSLKTKIIYLKSVSKGQGISYGHTYVTPAPRSIATLPIGYGDGYPRILSNNTDVLIKHRRCRSVGTICMDHMMVDVSSIKPVKIGQEVILIGRQGKEEVTAEELAKKALTIPYEIVCGIGNRVARIYIN